MRVTLTQSDPPAGMTSEAWLALVLTVRGLVLFTVAEPYGAVQVEPPLGTCAAKPAQLAVAETPAAMVTVSFVVADPPVQTIVNVHRPAATVCAGRFVKAQTVVMPPDVDRILQLVVRVPIA